MNIDRLMSELGALKYKSDTSYYSFDVIHREDLTRVEQVIRQFLLDNHDSELGELKAKCYAYEKIIANSNFAPMIIKENEGDDTANLLEEAEQKTGRWIDTHDATKCYCFNCNVRIVDALGLKIEDAIDLQITPPPYCPNCGAKMVEPQESEDRNEIVEI